MEHLVSTLCHRHAFLRSQPISLAEHVYKWIVTKKDFMCECFRFYNNAFTIMACSKRQRFRGWEEGVGPWLR